jgi:hypothetical protein
MNSLRQTKGKNNKSTEVETGKDNVIKQTIQKEQNENQSQRVMK